MLTIIRSDVLQLLTMFLFPLTGCTSDSFWARRGTIDAVCVDPQERYVVVGGRDVGTGAFDNHGDVKLYTRSGQVLHHLTFARRVTRLAFSPSGDHLAVVTAQRRTEASASDNLFLFSLPALMPPAIMRSFTDLPKIETLQLSASADRAMLGSSKGTIEVMELRSGDRLLTVPVAPLNLSKAVADSNLEHLLVPTDDHGLELFRVGQQSRGPWHIGGRLPAGFLRDRPSLITTGEDNASLDILDLGSMSPTGRLRFPHAEYVQLGISSSSCIAVTTASVSTENSQKECGIFIWPEMVTEEYEYTAGTFLAPFKVEIVDECQHLVIIARDAIEIVSTTLGNGTRSIELPPGSKVALQATMIAYSDGEAVTCLEIAHGDYRLLWRDRWRKARWSSAE